MLNEVIPRMTKRVHMHKPKPKLEQSEQDFLKTVLSSLINILEDGANDELKVAKENKRLRNFEWAAANYKNVQKIKNQIKKLSAVQHKIKRGLI